MLADPPAVLHIDGEWHECPLPAGDPGAAWIAEVRALLGALPDDTQLVAVDLHS